MVDWYMPWFMISRQKNGVLYRTFLTFGYCIPKSLCATYCPFNSIKKGFGGNIDGKILEKILANKSTLLLEAVS